MAPNTEGKDEILTYQPLAVDSAVSANPHIPSVTASAVLGESESVRNTMESASSYAIAHCVIKASADSLAKLMMLHTCINDLF